jgi:hypothetical protein
MGYVGEGDDPQLAEVEVGYRRLALPFPKLEAEGGIIGDAS